jgi:hypothetical protein
MKVVNNVLTSPGRSCQNGFAITLHPLKVGFHGRNTGSISGGRANSNLRRIKTYDIAEMRCGQITSADIIAFAHSLKAQPQTVQNYLSHLAAVFAIAKPAWGFPSIAKPSRTHL